MVLVEEYRPHLESFLQPLNTFHPNLHTKSSKHQLTFQMLWSRLTVTDLYSKPTDCHQFLELNSAHPIHIKKSIVYSLGLRIKRLRSSSLAFEKHRENIRSWFGKRGSPRNLSTITLEGQQKIDWSSYLNIKQNMELVCPLWLHTILSFVIQVGSLQKI